MLGFAYVTIRCYFHQQKVVSAVQGGTGSETGTGSGNATSRKDAVGRATGKATVRSHGSERGEKGRGNEMAEKAETGQWM